MAVQNGVTSNGAKKPNLIIFMPDQLRYDALGYTGNKEIRTPNIDAYAKRSVTFSNNFAQASVCAQSRCSIFLAKYPHISGHRSLDTLIEDHESDMFKVLREQGYHMAHLSPRGHMYAKGVTEGRVDEYGFLVPPGCADFRRAFKKLSQVEREWGRLFYGGERTQEEAFDFDEAVTRGAEEWLKSAPPEPFCLFLPLIWPHCPFEAEEPYFSMYNRSEMSPPVSLASKSGYEPQYMRAVRERYGITNTTPEMWAEIKATYYGMISRLDDQFGRIMKIVEERNMWNNTITSFFTDHGEYLGDHGLIEKWPSGVSDCLVKEPLIMGGGCLPEGVVVDDMTEMVDFLPTILQLCHVEERFPHNGKSMLPIMKKDRDTTYVHKEYAFSEGGFLLKEEPLLESGPFPYDQKGAIQHEMTEVVGKATACRDKEWTYVYRLYEPAELYNRVQDPGERHNLAGQPAYSHVEAKYREVIFHWLVETADCMPWKRDIFYPDKQWVEGMVPPAEQLAKRMEARLGMDHPLRV